MALARLKNIESLRYLHPGEWGKLIGLDRIPEAHTLRDKIDLLTQENRHKEWGADLCKQWMGDASDGANYLYIDGHVRVYHGSQTKLPRHYVSRQKLCANGTCDYWVNGRDGQPFFYVTKTVNPGLTKVLENDIVPELELIVPSQPTKEELEKNKTKHRFTLVFDREGYSPDFMHKMWKLRIACMTYTKKQSEDWDLEEFLSYRVELPGGEIVERKIAERGVLMFYKNKELMWVREIRQLKSNNKQGSITTTNYESELIDCCVSMFLRWSQENFFGYMMQHYDIDRLIEYKVSDMDDTSIVINPYWRELDSKIRKKQSILNRKKTEFATISLDNEIDSKEFKKKKKNLLNYWKKSIN